MYLYTCTVDTVLYYNTMYLYTCTVDTVLYYNTMYLYTCTVDNVLYYIMYTILYYTASLLYCCYCHYQYCYNIHYSNLRGLISTIFTGSVDSPLLVTVLTDTHVYYHRTEIDSILIYLSTCIYLHVSIYLHVHPSIYPTISTHSSRADLQYMCNINQ